MNAFLNVIAFHVVLEETGMLEHFSTDFARDFVGAVDAPLVLLHLVLFHCLATLVANFPLSADHQEFLGSIQVKRAGRHYLGFVVLRS